MQQTMKSLCSCWSFRRSSCVEHILSDRVDGLDAYSMQYWDQIEGAWISPLSDQQYSILHQNFPKQYFRYQGDQLFYDCVARDLLRLVLLWICFIDILLIADNYPRGPTEPLKASIAESRLRPSADGELDTLFTVTQEKSDTQSSSHRLD
jgi:hypothetical protein